MAPDTAPARILQPHRCPDCGYSLRGLPGRGTCPECGAAYDPDQIVLYGWAGASKSNVANSPRAAALWGGVLFALAFGCIATYERGRIGQWGVAAAAVFLVIVALTLYRRRSLGDPPVQVRFLPEGVAQRDGVGPVTPEPWAGRWELQLLPQPSGRWRLVVHKVVGKGGWDAALCFVDFEFHTDKDEARELCRRVRAVVDVAGGEIEAATV